MSWIKILAHDIRCGLLRWRYLLAPGLVILAYLYLGNRAAAIGLSPSLGDMMLYAFGGADPVVIRDLRDSLDFPFQWALIISGVLLLNLDYMLYDLTNLGQQVIVRSRNRSGWFLSKCAWNFTSTCLCFAAMLLMAVLGVLHFGGELSLVNSPGLSRYIGGKFLTGELSLTSWQTLMAGILAPFVTLAALSMLQMTMCLFVKPVVAFLICQVQLILAIFWKSPFCLGEGSMVLRSSWVATDYFGPEYAGVSTCVSAVFALAVLVICVIVGVIRFRHMDILSLEE